MKTKTYDGYYKYDVDVANTYDQTRSQQPHWKQEQRFIENYLRNSKTQTLLDIPVGTGRFLPNYVNIKKVFGVDISEEMLHMAQEKIKYIPNDHISLQRGDVFNLQFSSELFDTVIVFRLLHLLPSDFLDSAIKEICRVSKNEVVVQTYVPKKKKYSQIRSRIPSFLKRYLTILRKLPIFNRTDQLERNWTHINAYFHAQEKIDEKFASNGFSSAHSETIDDYGNIEVKATIYIKSN